MEAVLPSGAVRGGGLKSLRSGIGQLLESIHDHFVPHARNGYHPHALRHSTLALWSLLLVAVKIGTVVILTFGPVLPAYSSAITQDNVITLTNESRSEFKLGTLTYNPKLTDAAQKKADDMLAKKYFAHNTPDGLKPWDFIKAAGYSYVVAGENLAIHFQQVEDVEEAWMNSPGHRANILNKDFQEIGIGIAQGVFEGYPTTIVVQMFGAPIEQPYTALSEPTKVAQAAVPPVQKVQSVLEGGALAALNNGAQPVLVAQQPVTSKSNVVADASKGPVSIERTQFDLKDGQLFISVATSGAVSKVIAHYGQSAIMLSPASGSMWTGEVPLKDLVSASTPIVIEAYDLNGVVAREHTATFEPSLFSSLNGSSVAQQRPNLVSLFGLSFSPLQAASQLFILFIALGLVSLLIAIAVRKHIQHVNLIAHTSLVILLATMLWLW